MEFQETMSMNKLAADEKKINLALDNIIKLMKKNENQAENLENEDKDGEVENPATSYTEIYEAIKLYDFNAHMEAQEESKLDTNLFV